MSHDQLDPDQARARHLFQPGQSGNPGGRPKLPDALKSRLRGLSDKAVDALEAALDSSDERIRLAAAVQILDRAYGKPAAAIDATISNQSDSAQAHLEALLEVARKRRAEPIDLYEREVLDITPCRSDRE